MNFKKDNKPKLSYRERLYRYEFDKKQISASNNIEYERKIKELQKKWHI